MEDKDYIKDLFSEKLKGFEAKVDPSVWSGIQSQMATNAAAGTSAGIAIGTKIAAVVGGIAILGTAGYFVFSGKEEVKAQVANQNTIEQTIEPTPDNKNEINYIDTENINSNKEESSDNLNKEIQPSSDIVIDPIVIDDIDIPSVDPVIPTIVDTPGEPDEIDPNQPSDNGDSGSSKPPKENPLTTIISVNKVDANRFTFSSENEDVDYVEWNFGDGNFGNGNQTEHVFNSPGKYEVKATVFKGDEKVTVKEIIEIKQAGSIEAYPNIFSPNNDGSNDIFSIKSKNIETFNLTLYNSKGEVKFKTDDVNFQWTGENVEEGSYYYVIMATDIDGAMINEYHTLEIIRTRR